MPLPYKLSALPISVVSVGLFQSQVSAEVERHLLGATAAPATLIVHSTKHFSEVNAVSVFVIQLVKPVFPCSGRLKALILITSSLALHVC